MSEHPKQIIGGFVLTDAGDGCLLGKYHHDGDFQSPQSEACKRTTPLVPEDPFIGTFHSAWIESEGVIVHATITIARNNNNPSLFKIEWRHAEGGDLIFHGSGMLYNGLLVGCYWSK